MTTAQLITPHGPTAKKAAAAAVETLSKRRAARRNQQVEKLPALEVPAAIAKALKAMLSEYAEGNSVLVAPAEDDNELSTTAAARRLGMSRPTFINLLEAGEIKYRMVGSHRRVRLSDVEAYEKAFTFVPNRQNSPASRIAALQKMAQITHEAGLGY
jgi:excisionase family DNA binding protein